MIAVKTAKLGRNMERDVGAGGQTRELAQGGMKNNE